MVIIVDCGSLTIVVEDGYGILLLWAVGIYGVKVEVDSILEPPYKYIIIHNQYNIPKWYIHDLCIKKQIHIVLPFV